MTDNRKHLLASYVPPMVARHLALNPTAIPTPSSIPGGGVCPFLDIAGFTPLTERLARQGAAGAEQMATILSDHVDAFITVCASFGGEVVSFEGDAMLVVWWGEVREQAISAIAAAVALHEVLLSIVSSGHIDLSIKVTIAAGPVATLHVGGTVGRKLCLVAGRPLRELAELDALVNPGEVVVSAHVGDLAEAAYEGVPLESGAVRITSLYTTPTPSPLAKVPLPTAGEHGIREYVPPAVKDRIDAGQDDWLAEFRHISSVFVRLTRGSSLR